MLHNISENTKRICIILLLFFVTKFCFSQEAINKNNIIEKINSAYIRYEKYDETKFLHEVLDFIENNKIKINNKAIKGKLLYLKCIKDFNFYSGIVFESDKKVLEVIQVAKNIDDENLLAAAYHLISLIEEMKENRSSAMNYSKLAINIFQRIKANNQQIDVFYNLAKYSIQKKEWENAIFYANNSIGLITELNCKKSRLKYLHTMLAYGYVYLGNYPRAKINLKISEKLSPKNYHRSNMGIHEVYAKLYEETGNYKKANKEYNAMLKSKEFVSISFQKTLKKAVKKELFLQDKLHVSKDKRIRNQKIFLGLSLLFSIIIIIFLIRLVKLSRKSKERLNKIKLLNNELKESVHIVQSTNLNLEVKNNNIKDLLALNERTLFSKVLKISTFNDAISKIRQNISKLIEANEIIKPNNLFHIEKNLMSITKDDDIWDDFKIQFENTRPNFFDSLAELSSDLTVNDLKHCAYIIAKLRTKDVASLINVSPRSVETTRYRIKKKFKLDNTISLFDFLQNVN